MSNDFERDAIERSHEVPILVDFWAEWCTPCRLLGPVLERLAGEYEGKFLVVKADIERMPDVAASFGVRSIPSVFALKDGQVIDGFIGAQSESIIRAFIDRLLTTPAEAQVAKVEKLEASAPDSINKAYYTPGIPTKTITVLKVFRNGREKGMGLDRDALVRDFRLKKGSSRAYIESSEEVVGIVEGEILKWWEEPGSSGGTKLHWVCPQCGLQQWGDWTVEVPNPCLWYSDCPCIDKWLVHWGIGPSPRHRTARSNNGHDRDTPVEPAYP